MSGIETEMFDLFGQNHDPKRADARFPSSKPSSVDSALAEGDSSPSEPNSPQAIIGPSMNHRIVPRSRDFQTQQYPAGLIVPPIFMPETVLEKIWSYLDPAIREPEAGGLLLGRQGTDNLVLDFVFDEEAVTTHASYTLGTKFFNRVLADAKSVGLDGKGIVHSHPGGFTHLSGGDLAYAAKLFEHCDGVQIFLMPVIEGSRLFPWVVTRQAPSHPVLSTIVLI